MRICHALLIIFIFSQQLYAQAKKPEREFEIYNDLGYGLFRSDHLARTLSDIPSIDYHIAFGLYVPIFNTLGFNWDIGHDTHYVEDLESIQLKIGDLCTFYQSLLLTQEINAHRISVGARYHASTVMTKEIGFTSYDVTLNDAIGFLVSYEYVIGRLLVASLGLRYEHVNYTDSSNNSYPDDSLKVYLKMGFRGTKGLIYLISGRYK